MNTVTLGISSQETVSRRFIEALEGKSQGAHITFESPALLFKVLSGGRLEILKLMTGAGPLSIRELSRRVSRDVKAVHGDVQMLLKAGIIRKTEKGMIEFPFDAVHVDFMLQAA